MTTSIIDELPPTLSKNKFLIEKFVTYRYTQEIITTSEYRALLLSDLSGPSDWTEDEEFSCEKYRVCESSGGTIMGLSFVDKQ